MSLLKTVKPEEATGVVAEIYQPVQEAIGMVPSPLQLYSASPGLLASITPTREYFMSHPTLGHGLMALIRMLVAEEAGFNYCVSFNRSILAKMGVADDDALAAIMADPTKAPLPEKEKAMLLLVLKVCTQPGEVSESDVQGLRDLGWTDGDILDAANHGLTMINAGMLEKAFGLPEGAAC